MAQPKGEPLDFPSTLARIARHLESEDAEAQQTACSTLSTLLAEAKEPPGDLSAIAGQLIRLLGCDDSSAELLTNAAAAVSAAIEASDAAAKTAVEAGLAETVVKRLQGSPGTDGLVFNLLVALGILGAAGDAAAESVLSAGGMAALLAQCDPQLDEGLQEVTVDALCRLAAHSTAAKAAAVERGAIPALAAMLGSSHDEVRVRALLGLGMLLGEDAGRQRQLAEAPGAALRLLALMRQEDDLDSQHIAGELFRGLASNPELRQPLAEAMKAAHEKTNAASNFV